MQIDVHYEENLSNPKQYKSSKIGLTVKSDKELKSVGELDAMFHKLLTLAKARVRQGLEITKEELLQKEEGWR